MTGRSPAGTGSPGTTAVVPLRDGVSGKSRLAAVLDDAARRRLIEVLAKHVVGTLLAADGVDHVVVVTADPVFTLDTLIGLEVEVLEQPAEQPGLNAALEHARDVLLPRGADRMLVAHADLPALSPSDVELLLAEEASVVIATDRDRRGTNLLLVPFETGPVERRFQFRFGTGSLAAHLAQAQAQGRAVSVVHRPGTAVDLDTVDDWSQLPGEVRAVVGQQVPGLM